MNRKLFLVPVLLAGLGLIQLGQLNAQTFTTLHSFNWSEGAEPHGGLILSVDTLYGTASSGGSSGNGTVFRIGTDGAGFTVLHRFPATSGSEGGDGINYDGASPDPGLTLSGNTLYGMAVVGGSSGSGTVFAVNTNGTGFMVLHSFTSFTPGTNSDGAWPAAGLFLSDTILYGTAAYGGSSGVGTVFALNMDGTGFTNLHNFTVGTRTGIVPDASLILLGTTLYGTASSGGIEVREPGIGPGSVFKVNTDGTGFVDLYNFNWNDGFTPLAGLILSGNMLYGTTAGGGSSSNGTLFTVRTDGTGFTNVHSFAASPTNSSGETNSDGFGPHGLVFSGNTLYGTAAWGGSSGNGTLFAVNTDGTGFSTLHTFTGGSDGATPLGGLVLSGNTLYGAASAGGSSGNGTVFSISFTPELTIVLSGANLLLKWPTNYAGFDYTGYHLQSTTNLGPSAIWATNSPAPVVVNGQNTVTNPVSGIQRFLRLSQ